MKERTPQNRLNAFEQLILDGYSELSIPEEGVIPGNRDIRDFVNDAYGMEISRNAVARARRRIAHKLGFKRGW